MRIRKVNGIWRLRLGLGAKSTPGATPLMMANDLLSQTADAKVPLSRHAFAGSDLQGI